VAYSAREDNKKRKNYVEKLHKEFKQGKLKNKTLYIITDKTYLNHKEPTSSVNWEYLDGYIIIEANSQKSKTEN